MTETFVRSISTIPVTDFEVRRLDDYGDWRIVRKGTDGWISWEAKVIGTQHSGQQLVDVCGYPTKVAAQDALLRMAEATIVELRARLETCNCDPKEGT